MTTDIDATLGLVAQTWPSNDLRGFEDRVLTALHARRQQSVPASLGFSLASAALLMGIGGAIAPAEEVSAATVSPFEPHALAPSSLLLSGHR